MGLGSYLVILCTLVSWTSTGAAVKGIVTGLPSSDRSNVTITCDFEDGLCGWTAVSCEGPVSTYSWSRGDDSHGTPDRNSGPSSDHTFHGSGKTPGHFMYASPLYLPSPNGKTACLVSPPFSTSSNTALTFWFYMNGRNSDSLSLELLSTNTSSSNRSSSSNKDAKNVLWQTSGTHAGGWNTHSVTVPSGTGLKLQFISKTTFRFGADVAIDDIILATQKPVQRENLPTPSTTKRTTEKSPFYTQTTGNENRVTTTQSPTCTDDVTGLPGCDFDSNWCGFLHNFWEDGSGLVWVRGHRPPLSSSGVTHQQPGNLDTATLNNDFCVYLDTNDSSTPVGSRAGFKGHIRNPNVSAVCLEFQYATAGPHTPSIQVYNEALGPKSQASDRLMAEVKDNSRGHWKTVQIEGCVQQSSFISFQSQKMSHLSQVAINNIKIRRSTLDCSSTNSTAAVPPSTHSPVLSVTFPKCDFDHDFCGMFYNEFRPPKIWHRTDNVTVNIWDKAILTYSSRRLLGNGSFLIVGDPARNTEASLYANISLGNTTELCIQFDYIVLGKPVAFGLDIRKGATTVRLASQTDLEPTGAWRTLYVKASIMPGSQITLSCQLKPHTYIGLDNIDMKPSPCPTQTTVQPSTEIPTSSMTAMPATSPATTTATDTTSTSATAVTAAAAISSVTIQSTPAKNATLVPPPTSTWSQKTLTVTMATVTASSNMDTGTTVMSPSPDVVQQSVTVKPQNVTELQNGAVTSEVSMTSYSTTDGHGNTTDTGGKKVNADDHAGLTPVAKTAIGVAVGAVGVICLVVISVLVVKVWTKSGSRVSFSTQKEKKEKLGETIDEKNNIPMHSVAVVVSHSTYTKTTF